MVLRLKDIMKKETKERKKIEFQWEKKLKEDAAKRAHREVFMGDKGDETL